MTFPKVTTRGIRYPGYADVRFSDAALLMHQSVWDLTRILEHALKFAQKKLGITLAPVHLHDRRKFLKHFGYAGRVAGFTARPALVAQRLHVEMMTQFASGAGLSLHVFALWVFGCAPPIGDSA